MMSTKHKNISLINSKAEMFSGRSEAITHGGNIKAFATKFNINEEDVIDYSSNINPLGIPPKVRDIYHASLDKVRSYPDPEASELCHYLAQSHQLMPENVIAGNGSISLIDLFIRCLKPKKALLVEPCFNEYRYRLELSGTSIDQIQLNPNDQFKISLSDILEKLPDHDLIILGHPNNPTGTALRQDELLTLMAQAAKSNTYVLIDEAFIDWQENNSVIRHVVDFPTSLVTRSLTKFYALAGIRIGYACGAKALIDKMHRHQETWGCNSLAQMMALAALKDSDFKDKSLAWYETESAHFYSALKEVTDLEMFQSEANFFLCCLLKEDLTNWFFESLGRQGIYVRQAQGLRGVDKNYFRVALLQRSENIRLINQFKSILNQTQDYYVGNGAGLFT